MAKQYVQFDISVITFSNKHAQQPLSLAKTPSGPPIL